MKNYDNANKPSNDNISQAERKVEFRAIGKIFTFFGGILVAIGIVDFFLVFSFVSLEMPKMTFSISKKVTSPLSDLIRPIIQNSVESIYSRHSFGNNFVYLFCKQQLECGGAT